MRVRVLADDVINKIAAGEVVDRPASVVRELVDNALDAGARDIVVVLEDGGQRLIRVSDDGCGMERDDALLALERHATSKLTKADDLLEIATLGFRGEALPSIAAVSKLTLRTRPQSKDSATEILVEGGKVRKVQECASAVGTTIEARQLFFNMPARRKFLKSARSEELRIKSWISHAALSRPEVRFRLIADNRELLNIPRHESIMARARGIFPGEVRPCEAERSGLFVTGLVSHPSIAQMESGSFAILVNGRLVSDRLVLRAVREGFDSTLKLKEFPVGFVSIKLNPRDVDVNVHPQKSEVRFRTPGEVFEAVRSAVLPAVRSFMTPLRAEVAQPTEGSVEQSAVSSFWEEASAEQPAFLPAAPLEGRQQAFFGMPSSLELTPQQFCFSDLRYIGQLLECYLLTEYDDKLYVVDMHAAHERYNYNVIRKAFRERSVASQQLLLPVTVTLTERGLASCMKESALFEQLGFSWDNVGPNTLAIRGIPGFLQAARAVDIVKEIASLLDGMDAMSAFEQHVDSIAARLACHASIRSGKMMEREEVYALFADLDSTEFSAACPHGRPVAVSFQREEIEAWFGRDR